MLDRFRQVPLLLIKVPEGVVEVCSPRFFPDLLQKFYDIIHGLALWL